MQALDLNLTTTVSQAGRTITSGRRSPRILSRRRITWCSGENPSGENDAGNPMEEPSFSRNKKWDIEEWIVLVKLYYENKDKTRTDLHDAVSLMSLVLNRRADSLGIEHDEKYRNINGLAMQFDRIKYIDTNGAKGLSAYSELANAAIEMYHNDLEGFNLLAENCWKKYGE